MHTPSTLTREISPPPITRGPTADTGTIDEQRKIEGAKRPRYAKSRPAAIEAGEVEIRDHLTYFVEHLRRFQRAVKGPRISFPAWEQLYARNQQDRGSHFVVHQHDHPISGVHYDLRLQFSDTSCISFAIPYGLPGNPNSLRPNRLAIETRVHNFWVGQDTRETVQGLLLSSYAPYYCTNLCSWHAV